MPEVSVIMPAYNVEPYIGASIDSILKQKHEDFELLVVDDGSTDGTAQAVGDIAAKDARVKLIRQPNGGVSAARNTGLSHAIGAYIAFLDGDDFWSEEFLSRCVERIERLEMPAFCYARTKEVFLDGRTSVLGGEVPGCGTLKDFFYPKTGEIRLSFHISGLFIPKDIIERHAIRFPAGIKQGEDTAFFYQLLGVAGAVPVDEVLTTYMRREESATTKAYDPADWAGAVEMYGRIEDFLREHAAEADFAAYKTMRGYHAYRFIRRTMKAGFLREADAYRKKFHDYIADFSQGPYGKWGDRQKAKLLLSDSPLAVKVASIL
ncbi:hypothetical protein TAMA11512_04310 [Selenomonas sp. TAMA-11512]|uniref:glycosyltransferase family 2 protein n=1 Tax=Selenomonas sp. TAMA-11512 TaxID=3095337 RepID=UPI00308FF6FE|nr:hypothetical protein TAMA11512_04310 [Selenomonas sp. TAMA-11512]